MKKKQLRNLFTLALLLSTPLFASENGATITRIQAAKEVAQQNLQVAKAKMQAGLAVAKQFGIEKKDVFVAASKAQAATFMQSPKANSAAIAAGTYAAYDAVKMVPAVNFDDSATIKTVKYAGKAVAGASAFATQFAAIKFLVSNWNVLLHPMQDKVKTAKVLAVALANIAYYTPQVRALVVKAASYIDSNVFIRRATVADHGSLIIAPEDAAPQGPVVTEDQDGALTSSDKSSSDTEYFEATTGVRVQEKEVDSGIQEEAKVINPKEAQFIKDAINACDKSSNSPLRTLFLSKLFSCNGKEYIENYKEGRINIYVLLTLLPDTYASGSVGIEYIGTRGEVRILVNSLLKHYMVKSLKVAEGRSSDELIINTEITRIIAELDNM